MSRLPSVGGDTGSWGTVLNDYLATLPLPAFRLYSNGTTVTAMNAAGAQVASGTDGGAVLAACLPAAGAAGTHIEFRNDGNVFPWSTVPLLPKGITNKLLIEGNGATIQAAVSAGRRFLDFNRTADYDTFQNIEIRNVTFDRNNFTAATNESIFGNLIGGGWSRRINFDRITLRGFKTINVPFGGTGAIQSVSLAGAQLASGEGTANTITNILLEDCELGGDYGFALVGAVASGGTVTANVGLNVFIDQVKFNRVRTDRGSTPTAFAGGGNQIGGYAYCDIVRVRDCYFKNASDVGLEIDTAGDALVDGTQFEDYWNAGVLKVNFNNQLDANRQVHRYRGCTTSLTALRTTANFNATGYQFGGPSAPDNALGSVFLDDCQHINVSPNFQPGDAVNMNKAHPTGGYKQISVRGMKVACDGFDMTVNATLRNAAIQVAAVASTTTVVELSDIDVYINGTRHAGSASSFFMHALGFVGTGTFAVKVDGLTGVLNQANAVGTSTHFVSLGLDTDAGTYRGVFRRVGPHTVTGDTGPIGIRFGPGNTYTVLGFEDNDLSGASAGAEYSFATAGDKAKVQIARTRYRNGTVPAPTGLTGLVTATGKALGTGYKCLATFIQGTGTAITAIDYSTDGGTTYTNYLTQASGAIPAGFGHALGPLTSDALIKVTFTGTQPTITLVPVEP